MTTTDEETMVVAGNDWFRITTNSQGQKIWTPMSASEIDKVYKPNDQALDLHTLQQSAPRLHAQVIAYEEQVAQLTAERDDLKRERTAVRKALGEFYCPLYPDTEAGQDLENSDSFWLDQGVNLATLKIDELTAELEQARRWAAAWKRRAKHHRALAKSWPRVGQAAVRIARQEQAEKLEQARAALRGILPPANVALNYLLNSPLVNALVAYEQLLAAVQAAELSAEAGDAAGSESQ